MIFLAQRFGLAALIFPRWGQSWVGQSFGVFLSALRRPRRSSARV